MKHIRYLKLYLISPYFPNIKLSSNANTSSIPQHNSINEINYLQLSITLSWWALRMLPLKSLNEKWAKENTILLLRTLLVMNQRISFIFHNHRHLDELTAILKKKIKQQQKLIDTLRWLTSLVCEKEAPKQLSTPQRPRIWL